jgi:hypothetical protein
MSCSPPDTLPNRTVATTPKATVSMAAAAVIARILIGVVRPRIRASTPESTPRRWAPAAAEAGSTGLAGASDGLGGAGVVVVVIDRRGPAR